MTADFIILLVTLALLATILFIVLGMRQQGGSEENPDNGTQATYSGRASRE